MPKLHKWINNLLVRLRRKHRIYKCQNLGEIWFEVEEWCWYWPKWERWSVDQIRAVRFPSLYHARQAILFREDPKNNLAEELMEDR